MAKLHFSNLITTITIDGKDIPISMDFKSHNMCVATKEHFTPQTVIQGELTIRGWSGKFKKLRNYVIRKTNRKQWKARSRVTQIDKVTYLKWRSAKRKGGITISWGFIMRSRRMVRKLMKTRQVIFRGY